MANENKKDFNTMMRNNFDKMLKYIACSNETFILKFT